MDDLFGYVSDVSTGERDYNERDTIIPGSQHEAMDECVGSWLEEVLGIAVARVIVCLGKPVAELLHDRFGDRRRAPDRARPAQPTGADRRGRLLV